MGWFESMMSFVANLAISGTAGAATAGLIIWLWKTWISEKIKGQIKHEYDSQIEILKARLKSEGDVEIEKLKSQLSIAAAQRQVQFSHLHEKRAEVIAEIYASLREAVIAVSEYTKAFEPAGGSSLDERRKTAAEAANKFAMIYMTNQIYVTEEAANKLDEINRELKQAFIQFAYGVDLMRDISGVDYTEKWIAIGQKVERLSSVVMRELETEFRILLGDENS
jgi:hypothetical protein